RLTVGSGPDRLELYYFGPSTNRSGIFILIPALRVLLTGDAFGGKFLPALTRPDGGNGVEFPNTLTRALPLTRDVDTIVTGHSGQGSRWGAKAAGSRGSPRFHARLSGEHAAGEESRPDRGRCGEGVETA